MFTYYRAPGRAPGLRERSDKHQRGVETKRVLLQTFCNQCHPRFDYGTDRHTALERETAQREVYGNIASSPRQMSLRQAV
jgi:hypothetical protein